MKKVTIYTDGACSNNPGKGGWGVVLIYNEKKKELSGFEDNTTNNRMELTAAIKGLKALKEPCTVELYSDSAYLINAFNEGWVSSWKEKNWKNAKKKDVLNKDLWLEIIELINKHNVTWIKVKGHADNEFNNRCDELARKEIETH
jgi:ribonuclease HI